MIIVDVKAFFMYCKMANVRINIHENIITLTKTFEANNKEAYIKAEYDVDIIRQLPTTSAGSVWGTDSNSVGGYSALIHGEMKLNKSGVSKRFLKALQKLIAE